MFLNYLKFKPAYLLVFTILIASCSDDDALLGVDSPIAVSFDTDSKMVEVEETTTYDVVVSTIKPSASPIVVNLEVTSGPDSSLYSMTPSVTIAAGETSGFSTLSFSHALLDFGDEKKLVLDISSDQLDTDAGVVLNEERSSTEITFVKKCSLNDVSVDITTDDYPEETYFAVFDVTTDPNGVRVYLSDTFDGLLETTVETKLCLGTGSYAIVVYDLYGDGIVDGGFTVSVNGAEAVESTSVTGPNAVAFFDIE